MNSFLYFFFLNSLLNIDVRLSASVTDGTRLGFTLRCGASIYCLIYAGHILSGRHTHRRTDRQSHLTRRIRESLDVYIKSRTVRDCRYVNYNLYRSQTPVVYKKYNDSQSLNKNRIQNTILHKISISLWTNVKCRYTRIPVSKFDQKNMKKYCIARTT